MAIIFSKRGMVVPLRLDLSQDCTPSTQVTIIGPGASDRYPLAGVFTVASGSLAPDARVRLWNPIQVIHPRCRLRQPTFLSIS